MSTYADNDDDDDEDLVEVTKLRCNDEDGAKPQMAGTAVSTAATKTSFMVYRYSRGRWI